MSAQKPGLHPRNRHHSRLISPRFVRSILNSGNSSRLHSPGSSVAFADPLAVKALNKALLAHFYAVANWDIPDGFLPTSTGPGGLYSSPCRFTG